MASPRTQQIALTLARLHSKGHAHRVLHETIYHCIYAMPMGELRKDLIACLRRPTCCRPSPTKLVGIAELMRLSMTCDQGREMALHKTLSERTGVAVYFCDPHSPWQRGSNENMNGLVRQYLPKGTDLNIYSQAQLDAIAEEINGRPRKGLGARFPLAVYRELLLSSS